MRSVGYGPEAGDRTYMIALAVPPVSATSTLGVKGVPIGVQQRNRMTRTQRAADGRSRHRPKHGDRSFALTKPQMRGKDHSGARWIRMTTSATRDWV